METGTREEHILLFGWTLVACVWIQDLISGGIQAVLSRASYDVITHLHTQRINYCETYLRR